MERNLAHYRVIELLGAGGMGAVYRAHDTRLQRDVALKLLPPALYTDESSRQRLIREARSAAALNHPNICTIHEVGEAEGEVYIAMELVKGRPLGELIPSGGFPAESVLRYGTHIADALAHAHEHGVIHRDLKSSNVVVTRDGRAKVLDFGLARRTLAGESAASAATQRALTEAGAIVGTLHALAPEVLRGERADERSDIWALGVLLYELIAGALPFSGRSAYELSAAILHGSPAPLPPRVTPGLAAVIQRCLAKDAAQRFRSAAEVRAALEALQSDTRTPVRVAPPRSGQRAVWAGVALVMAALVATVIWLVSRQPWHTKELKQRQLTSNTAENPVAYGALSPDGRTLAVLDEGGLSLRSIDSGESSTLRIPEGFTLAGYPFVLISWFPDGSRLLLSGRSSDGKPYVWALPVLGGRARKLIVGGEFATISRDGKHLAFVRAGKEGNDLWCSGAQGEDPRPIVSSDSSGSISLWGVWSPNGHRLMYERITANARGFNAYLESCDLGGHRRVAFAADGGQNLHSATVPLWLPDGRLLFGLSDPPPSQAELNLWSLHVDPASGAPSGKPRRITQWQRVSLVAATGVSTDGRRLSLGLLSYQSDCFIGEIAPGSTILSSPRRLTMDDRFDLQPSWTSDGKAILFASDRNGTMDIFRQALDATEAEPLVSGEGDQMAPCTSPDGAWILYKDGGAGPVIRGGGSARIMRIPSSGGPPEKVLDTQAIAAFRCAKHAGTPCVLGELTGDHMVFTGFDPVRGRGPQLARVRVDGPEPWDLSPDGTKLAVMDKQDSLPRIRVVPLHGGPAHEVRLDRRIGITNVAWAADGSRWMVVGNLQKSEKGGWRMLRVEPGGRTSEMLPPQMWMYSAAASADGRHVVYTSNTIDSNIWLLENF